MRILLVEDNLSDAHLFEVMAREAHIPGMTVVRHTRLEDACRAVGQEHFDAVFLDLGLPDAQGLPVVTEMHATDPSLPLVVLTGRDEEALSLAALQNGAQDYLLKDRLTVEQLGQTIRFAIQRKRVELGLKQRERETHRAQKLEAIGQLAAGIAHEINTPMQFIGDNLFFLREAIGDLAPLLLATSRIAVTDDADPGRGAVLRDLARLAKDADLPYLLGELPAALDRSANGVERVTRIVRAMKEFSHPGSEERRLVHLASAVDSTLTVCRSEWKYVAEVETDISPDLPAIPCFQADLNQALLNLVVNAAHAIGAKLGEGGKEKGKITVAARLIEQWVEIRVSDTGTGIPKAARARIFEPFFTTKEVGKGTGQGLSVVYQVIVEKHGGTVDFESTEGEGTTFVMRLPIAPEDGPLQSGHTPPASRRAKGSGS